MMAGEFAVTVDTSKAMAVLSALSGPMMQAKLGMALREGALLGERTVAGLTPVKTGAARASIKATMQGLLAWRIASPLPYVPILEAGSRAHVIRPRRAKILAFQVGGARVFARQVRHPGTKGAHMFEQGAQQLSAAMPAILARAIGQ